MRAPLNVPPVFCRRVREPRVFRVKRRAKRGCRVTNNVGPREAYPFFLNDPKKLDDPFPDLAHFREDRPVFSYEPLDQWFVFGHEDVAGLFSDPRLSADRMKRLVDAAPEEVREDLRKVAPYLEQFVFMNDELVAHFLQLGARKPEPNTR
jgi:cytochrome P450